jgi:pimeloyl-ACP methyl ester carboxylesterase
MTRLVLLPGLDGTGALFRAFLDVCPASFEATAVSFPGDRELSYGDLEQLVWKRLVDLSSTSNDASRPLVLLGESFSGPLALRIASRQPERLAAVILAASFVLSPAPTWIRYLPWRAIFRLPLSALRRWLAVRGKQRQLAVEMQRALRQVDPGVLAGRMREIFAVDAREDLRRCPVPVLYIYGTRDRLVRRGSRRRIAALRPDAIFRPVPASHFVLQLAPRESWGIITEFMARVAPA